MGTELVTTELVEVEVLPAKPLSPFGELDKEWRRQRAIYDALSIEDKALKVHAEGVSIEIEGVRIVLEGLLKRGMAFRMYIEGGNHTQREASKFFGVGLGTVNNYVKIHKSLYLTPELNSEYTALNVGDELYVSLELIEDFSLRKCLAAIAEANPVLVPTDTDKLEEVVAGCKELAALIPDTATTWMLNEKKKLLARQKRAEDELFSSVEQD